ncbi:MAG: hypothetical protein ACRDDY_10600 [Clostridium sp.]|uniref:hypothetical protein n=1 Tax=Clostridium sp. TaxID=1506 RepID=UPI003EE76AC0
MGSKNIIIPVGEPKPTGSKKNKVVYYELVDSQQSLDVTADIIIYNTTPTTDYNQALPDIRNLQENASIYLNNLSDTEQLTFTPEVPGQRVAGGTELVLFPNYEALLIPDRINNNWDVAYYQTRGKTVRQIRDIGMINIPKQDDSDFWAMKLKSQGAVKFLHREDDKSVTVILDEEHPIIAPLPVDYLGRFDFPVKLTATKVERKVKILPSETFVSDSVTTNLINKSLVIKKGGTKYCNIRLETGVQMTSPIKFEIRAELFDPKTNAVINDIKGVACRITQQINQSAKINNMFGEWLVNLNADDEVAIMITHNASVEVNLNELSDTSGITICDYDRDSKGMKSLTADSVQAKTWPFIESVSLSAGEVIVPPVSKFLNKQEITVVDFDMIDENILASGNVPFKVKVENGVTTITDANQVGILGYFTVTEPYWVNLLKNVNLNLHLDLGVDVPDSSAYYVHILGYTGDISTDLDYMPISSQTNLQFTYKQNYELIKGFEVPLGGSGVVDSTFIIPDKYNIVMIGVTDIEAEIPTKLIIRNLSVESTEDMFSYKITRK